MELKSILSYLNAIVAIDNDNVENNLIESLNTHTNVIKFNSNNQLELVKSQLNLTKIDYNKLKGHKLSTDIMNVSVPSFTLQLYNNPCLHWFSQPALMILGGLLLTERSNNNGFNLGKFYFYYSPLLYTLGFKLIETHLLSIYISDDLRLEVHTLRLIFSQELVFHGEREESDFMIGLSFLKHLNILNINTNKLNMNNKFTDLILSSIVPYICCYYQTTKVLLNEFLRTRNDDGVVELDNIIDERKFTEKEYLVKVQETIEKLLIENDDYVHPYCLSLDSISLSLFSYLNNEFLIKVKV